MPKTKQVIRTRCGKCGAMIRVTIERTTKAHSTGAVEKALEVADVAAPLVTKVLRALGVTS